jgi:hypothetical protein
VEDFSYPRHCSTGSRGYFGKSESIAESPQRINSDPRSLVIFLLCVQSAQSPARLRSASPSLAAVIVLTLRQRHVPHHFRGEAWAVLPSFTRATFALALEPRTPWYCPNPELGHHPSRMPPAFRATFRVYCIQYTIYRDRVGCRQPHLIPLFSGHKIRPFYPPKLSKNSPDIPAQAANLGQIFDRLPATNFVTRASKSALAMIQN